MAKAPTQTEPAQSQAEEWYDDANEQFPSVLDLCPEADNSTKHTGRLVAVWAKEKGTAKGDSGPYDYVETVTLVLDDGLDGQQFTDLIGPAPVRLDLRHSTSGMSSRLKPRVDGVGKPREVDGQILPGVPLRFRPMIGRINSQPNTKFRTGSPAFSISLPTEADRVIIKAAEGTIVAINQELETKAREAAEAAAFE